MTLFLHVPELQKGIDQAEQAFGITPNKDDPDKVAYDIISKIESIRKFAETNVNQMLKAMGYNSIDELNERLQTYNNMGLQDMFPSFSGAGLTEVLADYNIGGSQAGPQYNLIASTIENRIRDRFPQYMDGTINRSDFYKMLSDSNLARKIGYDVAAELFSGSAEAMTGYIDFNTGEINFNDISNFIAGLTNKAKQIGKIVEGTNSATIRPFVEGFIAPLIQQIAQKNLLDDTQGANDLGLDTNSLIKLMQDWKNVTYTQGFGSRAKTISKNAKWLKDVLTTRASRGININLDIGHNIETTTDGVKINFYINHLTCDLDSNIFNLNTRKKGQSIEDYVEQRCKDDPDIRTKITKRAQEFYWQQIRNKLPQDIPGLQDKVNNIIEEMCAPAPNGNIGWFFSQGTTKAGGAGMFGEVIAMVYLHLLIPNASTMGLTLQWAGGTQDASHVKPAADVILESAAGKFGLQVKNYTSGSILSHEYGILVKNILDNARTEAENSDMEDLMTQQLYNELGISSQEIENVQNIIIANFFNVPYDYDYSKHSFFQTSNIPPNFLNAKGRLDAAFNKATKYMALASIIMHRLQYQQNVERNIRLNGDKFTQQQNSLWLINGAYFVSSVQILDELIKLIKDEVTNFFNVSASVSITKKSTDEVLPNELKTGRITIVEYFNYSSDAIRTTALSHVSAKIGTNYHMSSFHR